MIEFAEAVYPPAAEAAELSAAVDLLITVDEHGRVSATEVASPAGHGFDEAAQEAAMRFRFVPARHAGRNVPSRIRYTYEFRRTPRTAPGNPSPAQGTATRAPRTGAAVEAGIAREANVPAKPNSAAALVEENAPLEVTVLQLSAAEERRRSAEAVKVLETTERSRTTSDLGEVLAQREGIGVRREGGLGATAQLSLNGLTGEQVRVFVDGIPIELAGYPFGIANLPLNLIERVEVYSGVVPIRFGADALGGAVDLVGARPRPGTQLAASYGFGSFDTHRFTLKAGQQRNSGWFMRGAGFFDSALNDYAMNVEVADARGAISRARVHRFHDAYRSLGGHIEFGVLDRPWARRLHTRLFWTDFEKEYQHDATMSVPYGEAHYGRWSSGVNARYEQPLGRGVFLRGLVGYTHTRSRFSDVSSCRYDWFGRCDLRPDQAGETDALPRDQLIQDDAAFARLNLSWRWSSNQQLRWSSSPTYVSRHGEDRRSREPHLDALKQPQSLISWVNGLEYELDTFEDRLEWISFVKQYAQVLQTQEPARNQTWQPMQMRTHHLGAGSALRFRISDQLSAKGSYEWATRLLRAEEAFGDGGLVAGNSELLPERSHNFNLGVEFTREEGDFGELQATASGFLRQASQLVFLLNRDRSQRYENVLDARALGLEAALSWALPSRLLGVHGNATYADLRNTSEAGSYASFAGDRVPNRPYLFANLQARLQREHVMSSGDLIALTWNSRYVHSYYRTWESLGARESKQQIPAQLVHSTGLLYLVRRDTAQLSFSFEIQNLTDQAAFDTFGVQRPGRSFFTKTSAEL